MSMISGGPGEKALRLAMTGASGLIGSSLRERLAPEGHRVTRLTRGPATGRETSRWDPETGVIDPAALEGCDAVVHLAGENIGARWTRERKRRIRESRVSGTLLLARTLARLKSRPQVLVCASAVGYYGNRGDAPLTEESGPGTGFLAEVGRDWEEAASAAKAAGIRVVFLRQGLVLSSKGGALARFALPFRFGLGGRIGSGRQYMSWISLDDLLEVYLWAIRTPALNGPVNAVSPQPVTNAEFARAVGRALRRPAVFPLPAFTVRLALGEMAQEMLLSSTRVLPRRLLESGYRFRYPELGPALRRALRGVST